MQDEWPTHREELSRKTTETVCKYADAFDRNAISKREFYAVVWALSSATGGLVADDVTQLLADLEEELRGKK